MNFSELKAKYQDLKLEEIEAICEELKSDSNISTADWMAFGSSSLGAGFTNVGLICYLIADNQDAENDTSRCETLDIIAEIFSHLNDHKRAIRYAEISMKLQKKPHSCEILKRSYEAIGNKEKVEYWTAQLAEINKDQKAEKGQGGKVLKGGKDACVKVGKFGRNNDEDE